LLTRIGGDAWRHVAARVAERFGIDMAGIAIGYGCEIEDHRFEWRDRREIDENGCLLVRPDGYVAWRCRSLASDAEARLMRVVAVLLGRPETDG
jgi:2,4-dichlorophenol 6-monooxygenase